MSMSGIKSRLEKKFERASERVWKLNIRPANEVLLRLYALFKQATEGDVEGRKPYSGGLKEIAKWNAWSGVKGTSSEDAMTSYVNLVDGLFV